MYLRIVTFRLDGLTAAEYRNHVAAVAPAFTAWPGLLAKVWIADDEAGTYGGIYLFADQGSADRSRETDIFRSMAGNPMFADLSVRELSVLDEPTVITAPALVAARTR
jgi:Putative mono-oxygenase ydhR